MGRAELSNLFLALAARSCCNKYDSTWRPGGLEAWSFKLPSSCYGPRDQLKNIFYLYIKVNIKTENPHMQSQSLRTYKGIYEEEKNPHAISIFTHV